MPTSMLGISARMQAGKTTLSKSVAEELAATRISFGSVVKAEAQIRGIEITRESLQNLGQELVDDDVRGFCERVLQSEGWTPGQSIVVDGVRHVRVLTTLREIVEPEYFGLMFLNIDRATQIKRMKDEDLPSSKSLDEQEQHPTEIEVVTKLPDYADLILDGNRLPSNLVRDVIHWCEHNTGKQTWEERNHRRIELAKQKVHASLTSDEKHEFELLQSSYMEYLQTKFSPLQHCGVDHQRRLKEIQKKLTLPPSEDTA